MRPDVTYMQERVCACGNRKREKQSVHVSSFLQVNSVVLRTKTPFHKSEVL